MTVYFPKAFEDYWKRIKHKIIQDLSVQNNLDLIGIKFVVHAAWRAGREYEKRRRIN